MGTSDNSFRIFDTATGKVVEQRRVQFRNTIEWVEVDPIGKRITPEQFAEKQKEAEKAAREEQIRHNNLNPEGQQAEDEWD